MDTAEGKDANSGQAARPAASPTDRVAEVVEEYMAVSTRKAFLKYALQYSEFASEAPDSEEKIIAFLTCREELWAPTTMWTVLSHIKRFLKVKRHVDIGEVGRVKQYIRALEKNYEKTKAPAFTREEVFYYFAKVPYEGQDMANKLVVVFGALRVAELVALTFGQVQVTDDGLLVVLGRTKTEGSGESKFIPALEDAQIDPGRAFVRYKSGVDESLGYDPERRLFLRFNGGASENRPLGNTNISGIARISGTGSETCPR